MSAPQQMLRQGEHPVYPPGYPEKNKILIENFYFQKIYLENMKSGILKQA
jgi:hypothetical protein